MSLDVILPKQNSINFDLRHRITITRRTMSFGTCYGIMSKYEMLIHEFISSYVYLLKIEIAWNKILSHIKFTSQTY